MINRFKSSADIVIELLQPGNNYLLIIFLLHQSKRLFLVCNRKISAFLIFRCTPEVELDPVSVLI